MCGIAGEIHYAGGAPPDEATVRRMTAMLVHRGPDDEGFYADGSIALGQRRLSIIDPAGGHQPLANEDETVWITYNGTIYNSPALRETLRARGHRFRTRSDTEVIVHAYEEYGLAALDRLNGMYAFALWDGRARRLLLARDPFGIKPLYFSDDGRRLRFASELKAFLAVPGFSRDVDPRALDEYLTYGFVPSPRTMFAGVRKVPPGHRVIVEDGSMRLEAFARHAPEPRAAVDETEAIAELESRLAATVERQMLSDVAVGALLSGGIDSATVVALMRQVSPGRIKTFTVGFEGEFAFDELAAARRSAALLGTEHHEVRIGSRDCIDAMAELTWHLDEPIAMPSAFAMYHLSRLAARHVKVVLTGQGADEPWGGYRRYAGERIGAWYRRIPRVLRDGVIEPLAGLAGNEAFRRSAYALGAHDPGQRFARVYAMFTAAMKKALYRDGGAVSDGDVVEALRYWQAPVAHLEPLAQQLYVETRLSLPDALLLYGDKMSMAFSLEARVPLLDLELMRFVEALPVDLRLRGWAGHKYLYRKAVRRWVPAEIIARKKIGFVTPAAEWLRGPLAGVLRDKAGAAGSAAARYFERAYVDRLIDEHVRRRADHTRALFNLLALESWHERFVAGPLPQ